MSETRTFPRWARTECDICGCSFQVTRTEPRTLTEVRCPECDSYERGYTAGVAQLEAEAEQGRPLRQDEAEG